MNIINKLQEQLSQFKITRTTLDNLKNIDTFKQKFCIAPAGLFGIAFYFVFYFVSYNSVHPFCAAIMSALLSLLFIVFLHTYISNFKINGWFFKASSLFLKKSRLHYFIGYANDEDKLLLDMFNNSSISLSILEFYKTLNKINFSYSQSIDNVNFSNDEVAFNLQKISYIIDNHDETAFLKFFKNRFLSNFYYYSQHPNVIEFVGDNNVSLDNSSIVEKSFLPMQDILDSISEPVDLKQKFKAAL